MDNLCHLTDDELVKLYVNGCNEAFDLILQRHQGTLYKHISLQLKAMPSMIDDVFQETFVKVIQSLKEGCYQPVGLFRAWLLRIAHNVVMDIYRDESMMPFVDTAEEGPNSLEGIVSDTYKEAEMVNEQTLCDVKNLMNNLPDNQREVVYLRYYENRSFKEISEMTGATLNTCLGRMRYGIINMRRMAKEADIELDLL